MSIENDTGSACFSLVRRQRSPFMNSLGENYEKFKIPAVKSVESAGSDRNSLKIHRILRKV